jgi:hypothetical protein
VTAQLIAKNMNIAPTLEIRPGYRFNVIVTKDMTFSAAVGRNQKGVSPPLPPDLICEDNILNPT